MSSDPSRPPENGGLIIRPSTGLVSLPTVQTPVLSEIVSRSITHIQTSKALGTLYQIEGHELYGPDYRLVCNWAEQLGLMPAEVLITLLEGYASDECQTVLAMGRFKRIWVCDKLFGIKELPQIDGLVLEWLHLDAVGLCKLDLFTLPNLTRLDCPNNALTSLDLSPVPDLTWLNCSFNPLTSLNFSVVPKLTSLRCVENQLTDLDLSAVSSLRFLFCGKNHLTNLDLSGNPNLGALLCEGNQLTSLDLSPVSDLRMLACDENYLTSLDLSMVPDLHSLSCKKNQLTGLDIRPLRDFVKLNSDPLRIHRRRSQQINGGPKKIDNE